MTFKTQVCKRCRCQFQYEAVVVGTRIRSRRLCDPCAPIAKAGVIAAYVARVKENMQTVRAGMDDHDPFKDLVVRGYASVGRLLGITSEAVRRAEATALTKARKKLHFERLTTRIENNR
jgi:hypothetical protein